MSEKVPILVTYSSKSETKMLQIQFHWKEYESKFCWQLEDFAHVNHKYFNFNLKSLKNSFYDVRPTPHIFSCILFTLSVWLLWLWWIDYPSQMSHYNSKYKKTLVSNQKICGSIIWMNVQPFLKWTTATHLCISEILLGSILQKDIYIYVWKEEKISWYSIQEC